MPYKKILVSLSGKDYDNNVIQEAIGLATALDADLIALHVNDPGAGKAHMMMDSLPKYDENDIREEFRKSGYEKEAEKLLVSIVTSEHYAKAIAKATEDVDLLVIGHHHKNRFLSVLSESLDEQVADLVSCPVLLVYSNHPSS